jgi:hypothetical protein
MFRFVRIYLRPRLIVIMFPSTIEHIGKEGLTQILVQTIHSPLETWF